MLYLLKIKTTISYEITIDTLFTIKTKTQTQSRIKIGINQLPKPPMAVGITKKKIIRNA
jgi:hypothetical protein